MDLERDAGRDGGRDGGRDRDGGGGRGGGSHPDRTLEVCREFTRQRCNRSVSECRYAHPPSYVEVNNGRVTCCVDSIKGRCRRDKCRYFHPPPHLGDKVLYGTSSSGNRSSLPPPSLPPLPRELYGLDPNSMPYQLANTLRSYKSALDAALAASWLTGGMQDRAPAGRSDTIEVCREFLRGKCTRTADTCRYAHPPDNINVGYDNTVIACIDFIKGRCQHDPCRYFHPPEHLQSRVRFGGSGGTSQGGRKRPYSSTSGGGGSQQGDYGGAGDYSKRAAYDDGGP